MVGRFVRCAELSHGKATQRRLSPTCTEIDYGALQAFYLPKAKFHYAILVADRSKAGRRHAASWNLAYR